MTGDNGSGQLGPFGKLGSIWDSLRDLHFGVNKSLRERLDTAWLATRPARIALGLSAIAAMWLFWGTLHFVKPEIYAQQVPDYVPRPKEIFALAGIVEVILGLSLFTRWRKHALAGTCALLILFVPAVVYIEANDAALLTFVPDEKRVETLRALQERDAAIAVQAAAGATVERASPAERAEAEAAKQEADKVADEKTKAAETKLRDSHAVFWRVFIVFHNALFFLLAYGLYRPVDEARRADEHPPPIPRRRLQSIVSRQRPALIVAVILLLANVAGISATTRAPWYTATPTLWALGCLAGGALVGFIFAVPKTSETDATSAALGGKRIRYRPNTNIETLSDWLTKMLVGVGLVEFHKIGDVVTQIASVLASGLVAKAGARATTAAEAEAFAQAIIIYFTLAGLIEGYLLTRMFLAQAFEDAEGDVPANSEKAATGHDALLEMKRDSPPESG